MAIEKILAIYGATLSTLLAIPNARNFLLQIFSPIRFICIDGTQFVSEKMKSETSHLFEITVINRQKDTKYFSNISLEMKNKYSNEKGIAGNNLFLYNTDFNNKLESGENKKEIITYTYQNNEKNDLLKFDYYTNYRVIIEDSNGKKYKSKWYKSPIHFPKEAAKWTIKK